jgi:hypothetical protein
MTEVTFEGFPKIYRLSRPCIITEKLDGTNAQVIITEDGQVAAASRTRLITPEADNMGFARWVQEHAEELRQLGPGRHFGEWWGSKIQRGYGLKEKRFSLFNTSMWAEHSAVELGYQLREGQQKAPYCCGVVPTLFEGPFTTSIVDHCIDFLQREGSQAAPGFMQPEGVVVYHTPGGYLFKKTLEKDEAPKGAPR